MHCIAARLSYQCSHCQMRDGAGSNRRKAELGFVLIRADSCLASVVDSLEPTTSTDGWDTAMLTRPISLDVS